MFHPTHDHFGYASVQDIEDAEAAVRAAARRSLRQLIRKKVLLYDRGRLLPTLIFCPREWLTSTEFVVCNAILRRLRLALYQQRQARNTRHYTFSQSRYEALLIAIGGELRIRRALRLPMTYNTRPI